MKTIPFFIACLVIAAPMLIPSNAKAGAREDIIHLTHKLEDSVAQLQYEFNAHFRGTREYNSLVGCVRSLSGRAAHIRGLAHDTVGAARELRSDVKSMDATIHRIHDQLKRAEAGGRRTGGSGCTKRVNGELSKITRILHQLEGLATLRIKRSNERQASRQYVPAPLNPLQHNSSYYHPHYGTGNRNVGNLVFPNRNSYSQPSQHSSRNSYSHQYYGNRGSTYSNRGSYRQPSTNHRYGYQTNQNRSSRSSHYSSNRGSSQPADPAKMILESIFRGLQQR